ncbi:MAG TPA: hypothetical protein PKD70_06250 [Saprospiraceae bacterium]|nr:hypothetical protein [Saprospiraceae bacterium]HMP13459.1 hypothetical protein [Saprospiraceae bacterium]
MANQLIIRNSYDLKQALRSEVAQNFPDANRRGDGFLIYPKKWRANVLLVSSKSSYTLSLYPGQNGADHPLDIKLDRNNVAAVSHIGLTIQKQNVALTPSRYFAPFTWPDANYFAGRSAAGTAATEAESLENIYNGTFTLRISNVDVMKGIANNLFRWVPERTYEIADAEGPQLENVYGQWGYELEQQGLFFIGGLQYLNGQQNNDIVVNLSDGDYTNIAGQIDNAGEAVDTRNLLTVTLFGFEIADAATAQPKF